MDGYLDFKLAQGWQGAITLPRDLSINKDGRLIQKPSPEIQKLRGELVTKNNIMLNDDSESIDVVSTQFELIADIAGEGTDKIGFRFNTEDGEPYEILITPESLYFNNDESKLSKN